MAAELVLLLFPATVVVGVIVWLSYPAYPPPELQPLSLAFDACMIVVLLGVAAAWRLGVSYVIRGDGALRRASSSWSILLALGAIAATVGAIVAGEHMLHPERARDFVGFALLSPAVPLLVIAGHFLWLRRQARIRA